jgi:hypothetical protein
MKLLLFKSCLKNPTIGHMKILGGKIERQAKPYNLNTHPAGMGNDDKKIIQSGTKSQL